MLSKNIVHKINQIIIVATYFGASSFQADACHAYQILHKHGIPDENIVVMMYDDIAYNKEWVLHPYGC